MGRSILFVDDDRDRRRPPRWAHDRGTWFYRIAAILALVAVAIGFHTTYTVPVLSGSYGGPWWGHIHGALATAWVLLVIAQSWLVPERIAVHRRLGWAALALIPLWFASTVMLARESALIAVANGELETAQSNVLGALASPILVCVLIGLAIRFRKRPQAHKRLIFVGTVLMLWPAFVRWRHYFADPESLFNFFGFWVAFLPILIAMIRDKVRFGGIHPALLWGGLFAIGEQAAEIVLFESSLWNAVSLAAFKLIT